MATRYKNDTKLRKQLYVDEAMSHPAKGHLGLWADIIDRYTQPGQTVLDPMSGVGATLLAARMGRDAILVEKESHFVEPMKASWAKMRTFGPELGATLGSVTIIQGDARNLEGLMADCVITSPPYEASPVVDARHLHFDEGRREKSIADKQDNGVPTGYTRKADAIVTSPPYEGSDSTHLRDREADIRRLREKGYDVNPNSASQLVREFDYSLAKDSENIGNLRNDAYWSAMREVYQQCWNVLNDNGVMVLVTKGFTRDGKYVDLPGQTRELCESLGFVMFDEWLRELWSLSFWRILQQRRDPEAFDNRLKYETVQTYRKVGGSG